MEQLQMTLESRAFELSYERTSRQVEIVCEAERFRQLQVCILILEEQNDNLRAQLVLDDERIGGLERWNERLHGELEVCAGSCESAREELRIKSREIVTMKAELNSLHGVTMDSTRLLTEKLTLARELSALKPEVDHLRSQATSHQLLLAEKLSLQRHLSTVQVELATEKRAGQRTLAREDKLQAEDAKLESRLESLQADLAEERRERQKVEREAQKDSIESGKRMTTLESRLDAFRKKLQSTKDQLKEAQTSLEVTQSSNQNNLSRAPTSVNPPIFMMENSNKRGAAQMDAGTVLGTPGDFLTVKKSKRGSTLIGEKSTFSITPFLNRKASVALESPPPEIAIEADASSNHRSKHLFRNAKQKAASSNAISDSSPADIPHIITDVAQANKPGILQHGNTSKIVSRAHAQKTKAAPILGLVAEEHIEKEGPATKTGELAAVKTRSDDTFNGIFGQKRRQRKLLGGLGKSLFDEDEEVALKGDHGQHFGVGKFETLGNGGLRVPELGYRKDINVTTFGAISPLKKDKRVLNKR